MKSLVHMYEKPRLRDPLLIEGLPGIGFVANIAALYLITNLKAEKFGEIRSPFFQDLAVSTEEGEARFPMNELYYHKSDSDSRDLIILYGNTQALTTYGQYELCGRILDSVEDLGCHSVACMGGLRREIVTEAPKVYCTATDPETLNSVLDFGVNILQGRVFGAAGLLLGLARLRGMHGLCLLAETRGIYPDAAAARATLEVLCKISKLKIDLSDLEQAVANTQKILGSFGPLRRERRPEFPGPV